MGDEGFHADLSELIHDRERTITNLRARLEAAEAQAAAMRAWIEKQRHTSVPDQLKDGCYERAPACTCPPDQRYSHALSCAVATERRVMLCKCGRNAILSGDAGRALLDELRALREVEAAALRLSLASIGGANADGSHLRPWNERVADALVELDAALDAARKGGGR